jgi:hypothetical protein
MEVLWNYVTNETTILNLLYILPFSSPKSTLMFIRTSEYFSVTTLNSLQVSSRYM